MKKIRICIFLIFIPFFVFSEKVKEYSDTVLTAKDVDSLGKLAGKYFINERYLKSLELRLKIIDIYTRNGDTDNLVHSYNQIVGFFILLRNYDLAEKYQQIMIQTSRKSKNPIFQGWIFSNNAQIYLGKGDYDNAKTNSFNAIFHFHKAKAFWEEGRAYMLLGDALTRQNQINQAFFAYRNANLLFFQISNKFEIAAVYTRMAYLFSLLKEVDKNLYYNLLAIQLREGLSEPTIIASSYLNIGSSYYLLGKKDSARKYFHKALQLADSIKNNYYLTAIYSQLFDFAKQEKNYKEALQYYQKYSEYRKILNHDQNNSEITLQLANHTINEAEARNELLIQENLIHDLLLKRHRYQTIIYEIIFLAILAVVWFIHTLARNNRKRKYRLKLMNDRLQAEIQERTEAEERLHRSEEMHRFLAENTVDVISLLDANLRRIYISPSCEKNYGYKAQEILQMTTPLDLVEPSYRVNVNYRFLEIFRSKNPVRYNYKALRKDGSTFWAEASINPILESETGEIKEMITVVRDISEQMQHEEELAEHARQKEFLLREIHNRVKNNFAILNSLMTMQRDQSDNQELSTSLTELQLRVRTMSLVHEQLYSKQDITTIPFDDYLKSLTLIISSAYKNNKIRLETDIRPCILSIEMALPMGLIINELMTNSFKYAFPDDRSGTVSVKLLPEEGGKYSITICDDGIGLPENFTMKNTKSMGSQIVQILAEQLEASIAYSKHPGACFHILFSAQQDN
jgi:PAS domain S-box-containing protein